MINSPSQGSLLYSQPQSPFPASSRAPTYVLVLHMASSTCSSSLAGSVSCCGSCAQLGCRSLRGFPLGPELSALTVSSRPFSLSSSFVGSALLPPLTNIGSFPCALLPGFGEEGAWRARRKAGACSAPVLVAAQSHGCLCCWLICAWQSRRLRRWLLEQKRLGFKFDFLRWISLAAFLGSVFCLEVQKKPPLSPF